MNLFLTNEKNAKALKEMQQTIVEMKKTSMSLSSEEINFPEELPLYWTLDTVLKQLRGLGLLELNGNVSYSSVLEVDYLLDIIKTLRLQQGPASNFDIGEPSIESIIEGIKSTNIPLRALTTNGSAFRYYVTFYTLENILDHMMMLAHTGDEDVLLETFCHLENFTTQNGLFDRHSMEILSSDILDLPIDTKNILNDLLEAFKMDVQIKESMENAIEEDPDSVDDDDYEEFQERYDYIVLEQFMKAHFKRKLKSFNFQLSINGEVVSIQTAEDFIFKVFNHLNTEEQVLAAFKFLQDYLVTTDYFVYDDEYLVYAPTHSRWDDLIIFAIEENLFGPNALTYKKGDEISSKVSSTKSIDITRIREWIAAEFKENSVQ